MCVRAIGVDSAVPGVRNHALQWLKSRGTLATKYRCYLFEGDHIKGVEVIEAPDDATAQLEAGRILQTTSRTSAELWDRDRRVSILARR